jgi:P-type conjugative transfer protein TrbJ
MSLLRRVVAAGAIAIVLAGNPKPSSAQWIVFDPNTYAQNVLTAARALQQINNQITSLQNQAQMLINQGKNLAALPFSSLLQLEHPLHRLRIWTPRGRGRLSRDHARGDRHRAWWAVLVLGWR